VSLPTASGATVGGLIFDSSGYQATFELSAALLGAAAALAFLAARAASREPVASMMHRLKTTVHAKACLVVRVEQMLPWIQ